MKSLSNSQMERLQGGWWQFLLAYVVIEGLANLPDTINAIQKGWNAARR